MIFYNIIVKKTRKKRHEVYWLLLKTALNLHRDANVRFENVETSYRDISTFSFYSVLLWCSLDLLG